LLGQCVDDVGANCFIEPIGRDGVIRPVPDPGIGGGSFAVLVELLHELAERAAEKTTAAGRRSAARATAQQATESAGASKVAQKAAQSASCSAAGRLGAGVLS